MIVSDQIPTRQDIHLYASLLFGGQKDFHIRKLLPRGRKVNYRVVRPSEVPERDRLAFAPAFLRLRVLKLLIS